MPQTLTIENLITSYQGDADWYRNEMRFMEPDEKAVYAEARQICLRIVQDLNRLLKVQDAHTPDPS